MKHPEIRFETVRIRLGLTPSYIVALMKEVIPSCCVMNEILKIKVIPDADEVKVKSLKEDEYRITLTEPAEGGRANRQLIFVLAEHFDRSESDFQIVRGHKESSKYIKVHR